MHRHYLQLSMGETKAPVVDLRPCRGVAQHATQFNHTGETAAQTHRGVVYRKGSDRMLLLLLLLFLLSRLELMQLLL